MIFLWYFYTLYTGHRPEVNNHFCYSLVIYLIPNFVILLLFVIKIYQNKYFGYHGLNIIYCTISFWIKIVPSLCTHILPNQIIFLASVFEECKLIARKYNCIKRVIGLWMLCSTCRGQKWIACIVYFQWIFLHSWLTKPCSANCTLSLCGSSHSGRWGFCLLMSEAQARKVSSTIMTSLDLSSDHMRLTVRLSSALSCP